MFNWMFCRLLLTENIFKMKPFKKEVRPKELWQL